jgi:hypothetical protein
LKDIYTCKKRKTYTYARPASKQRAGREGAREVVSQRRRVEGRETYRDGHVIISGLSAGHV